MKKYLNKQFLTAFIGSLGAIVSGMVVQMMIDGNLQKRVKFQGAGEEIVFTFFVAAIGIISLGLFVSTLTDKG